MTEDSDISKECEGQNDRREIRALFEIRGLIHDYPTDFRKSESPDWLNYRIGLEATSVATKEERLCFDLVDWRNKPLGQLRTELHGQHLVGLCEFTEGRRKGENYFFGFRSEQIIRYEGVTSYRSFDELSPEDKKERDSSKVLDFTPDGLVDQGNELKRVLKRFGAKLERLQSYELCDEYHLHIASTWHFDRRCVEFIMDALMEKTLEAARKSWRVFDRVFLSADEAMCDFDLRAGKYRYICRRNITSKEDDSIIIPPGQHYRFSDAVEVVPDLSIPDPWEQIPEYPDKATSDDESDPGCFRCSTYRNRTRPRGSSRWPPSPD